MIRFKKSYIAFGLQMEVIVSILNAFMVSHFELFFKSLSEHVLALSRFLKQINENDESVVIDHIVQVLIESLRREAQITLNRCMSLNTLLLPEKRHTTSYLHEGVENITVYHYQFGLHEVGHITLVIEAPCQVPGPSHLMPSPRDQD